ncbi:lipoate--protein ligase [Sporomusa termitida]|uniref:Octanoyltransferase LipM n=1 Tax=Sporomusa termitida TaxID=2377 RepID=A0A517DWF7_9FIRM|nr:lipoate protein ligase C-terminal domain-containing protein [Sporomusa termitida]QDR81596.1 Octanoyltransferase LipM [Sporomusa termitida]
MPSVDNSAAFRVLDSAPCSAAEHMALDKVIISAHSQGHIPNTLRFLQFKPCVLVGAFQNTLLEVNVPYCQHHGIAINRRLTGGGSLYWGRREIGWELYAGKNTPGIPRQVEGLYRLLCEAMARGLRTLGLAAAYRPVNDIEIQGRKIAGTGGTELADSFVFQCSLLVDFDVEQMLRVLRFPLEKLSDKAVKSMRERVTSLKEQLGYVPAAGLIKHAIITGLQKTLGYEFTGGGLTALETGLLSEYLPYFQSEAWVYGSAGRVVNTVDCLANYKAPGGLIRIQMRLDEGIGVIKYLLISGDFFAYPARVINDLETALKNTPIDRLRIADLITNFFLANQAEIPGVLPEHFVAAILLAVEKAREVRLAGPEVCCENNS